MSTARRPSSKAPRLALLDVLRFVAALSVLAYHWLYSGISNGKVQTIELSPLAGLASYGYLGVHLFFLISGFVIANSVRGKTPAGFAVGRLVRLFPAFWAAVIITATIGVFYGTTVMTVTAPQVLANLTMVPFLFGQPFIDGVYWTLALELAFYAMVFGLLLLGFKERLDQFFPIWGILIALTSLAIPQIGIFTFFCLFAGGAVIATSHRLGWNWLRISALAATGFAVIRYELIQLDEDSRTSSVGLAIIIVGLVGLVILQTVPAVGRWRIPFSEQLGGLTYPLYLLHAHIGYMIFANFSSETNKWLVYTAAFLAVIAGSFLLRELVEVRAKSFWYRAFASVIGRPITAMSARFDLMRLRMRGYLFHRSPSSGGDSDLATSRVP